MDPMAQLWEAKEAAFSKTLSDLRNTASYKSDPLKFYREWDKKQSTKHQTAEDRRLDYVLSSDVREWVRSQLRDSSEYKTDPIKALETRIKGLEDPKYEPVQLEYDLLEDWRHELSERKRTQSSTAASSASSASSKLPTASAATVTATTATPAAPLCWWADPEVLKRMQISSLWGRNGRLLLKQDALAEDQTKNLKEYAPVLEALLESAGDICRGMFEWYEWHDKFIEAGGISYISGKFRLIDLQFSRNMDEMTRDYHKAVGKPLWKSLQRAWFYIFKGWDEVLKSGVSDHIPPWMMEMHDSFLSLIFAGKLEAAKKEFDKVKTGICHHFAKSAGRAVDCGDEDRDESPDRSPRSRSRSRSPSRSRSHRRDSDDDKNTGHKHSITTGGTGDSKADKEEKQPTAVSATAAEAVAAKSGLDAKEFDWAIAAADWLVSSNPSVGPQDFLSLMKDTLQKHIEFQKDDIHWISPKTLDNTIIGDTFEDQKYMCWAPGSRAYLTRVGLDDSEWEWRLWSTGEVIGSCVNLQQTNKMIPIHIFKESNSVLALTDDQKLVIHCFEDGDDDTLVRSSEDWAIPNPTHEITPTVRLAEYFVMNMEVSDDEKYLLIHRFVRILRKRRRLDELPENDPKDDRYEHVDDIVTRSYLWKDSKEERKADAEELKAIESNPFMNPEQITIAKSKIENRRKERQKLRKTIFRGYSELLVYELKFPSFPKLVMDHQWESSAQWKRDISQMLNYTREHIGFRKGLRFDDLFGRNTASSRFAFSIVRFFPTDAYLRVTDYFDDDNSTERATKSIIVNLNWLKVPSTALRQISGSTMVAFGAEEMYTVIPKYDADTFAQMKNNPDKKSVNVEWLVVSQPYKQNSTYNIIGSHWTELNSEHQDRLVDLFEDKFDNYQFGNFWRVYYQHPYLHIQFKSNYVTNEGPMYRYKHTHEPTYTTARFSKLQMTGPPKRNNLSDGSNVAAAASSSAEASAASAASAASSAASSAVASQTPMSDSVDYRFIRERAHHSMTISYEIKEPLTRAMDTLFMMRMPHQLEFSYPETNERLVYHRLIEVKDEPPANGLKPGWKLAKFEQTLGSLHTSPMIFDAQRDIVWEYRLPFDGRMWFHSEEWLKDEFEEKKMWIPYVNTMYGSGGPVIKVSSDGSYLMSVETKKYVDEAREWISVRISRIRLPADPLFIDAATIYTYGVNSAYERRFDFKPMHDLNDLETDSTIVIVEADFRRNVFFTYTGLKSFFLRKFTTKSPLIPAIDKRFVCERSSFIGCGKKNIYYMAASISEDDRKEITSVTDWNQTKDRGIVVVWVLVEQSYEMPVRTSIISKFTTAVPLYNKSTDGIEAKEFWNSLLFHQSPKQPELGPDVKCSRFWRLYYSDGYVFVQSKVRENSRGKPTTSTIYSFRVE